MYFILSILTFVLAVATLLPLSRRTHWFFRGMDFPRLQLSVVACLLLIAQVTLLDYSLLITEGLVSVTLLCLIWQLSWILPYTFLWSKEVKNSTYAVASTDVASANNDGKTNISDNHSHNENYQNTDNEICILTSNVLTPNRNSDALIDLVHKHKPDVLVTLESDQWWQDRLAIIEADMPYSVKCPLDNLYGMHVYSRLAIAEDEISYLVEDDVPSIHATIELRSGDKVRVHFLHPAPPSPSENTESAERDAELIVVARSVAQSGQPVIVAGDLNDVAWSATTRLFRKISGLLDPRVGRGVFSTFHAGYPIMRWPLDHLFHSHHFTLKDIQRLPSIGSDHFPLLTRLSFTPEQSEKQNGLKEQVLDDDDWATEITEKQEVSESDVPKPSKK